MGQRSARSGTLGASGITELSLNPKQFDSQNSARHIMCSLKTESFSFLDITVDR